MSNRMRDGLVKRGSTWSFVLRVPDPQTCGTKPKWHGGFRTREEAKAERDAARAALRAGKYVPPSRRTLAEFVDEWLPAVRPQVRENTWQSYGDQLRWYVLPRLGGVRLTELGPADLNRLYGELLEGGRKRGGGLSPRTVRYVHTILHRALRDAARWGWVPRNVADVADPPRVARAEMAIWQPAQLRAFLTHVADDRLYAMWLLFATTGMRRGEVAGLAWFDVDLDDGRLTVRQQRTKVGRHGRVVTGEPKGGREHTIALDGVTVAALCDHRRRQAAERLAWGAGWHDAGLLFVREDGTPLHPDAISGAFKRHIRDAGLLRIRPHDLRHSYASACLDAGVPVEVLSKRLGHASPNITREIYVHVLPKHDEQVAEAMAAAILGGPGLTREAR